MIGDATVVALSEATHGGAEPLAFRNRLFQYLVHEKGFTAIAIESGIVESRKVYEYARGGPDLLSAVLGEGFSWTFDQLPQNRSLVEWLRQYNEDRRPAQTVNFYGFDVSGSPGLGRANRGIDTALVETLSYLAGVDRTESTSFSARLKALMENLRFDLRRSSDALLTYDRLTQNQRDALTAAIADLVTLLERREADYTAASTLNDYEWAYRAAIGASQTDSWLRQIPTGWRASSEPIILPSEHFEFLAVANDVRDRAQADNLEWIVRREGLGGKILVYAHRYHLSATPVGARWSVPTGSGRQEVMGTYLRRRLGDRLVTIGNLIGKDGSSGVGFRHAPGESLDAVASEIAEPIFFLDLRTAPDHVARWLEEEHQLAQGDDEFKLAVGRAFDLLLYIDVVNPAYHS